MNKIKPEDTFLGLVGGMMFGPEAESGSLEDPPFYTTGLEKDRIQREAKRVVGYIKETIFPLLGV